jgi:Mycothiol maleylpyruvate isomerase N-terminal domain
MGTTLGKTQLLAELHHENASWQALLDEIGEANMTQPEVAGGWSIKDIVAHLTEWRRRTVRRFQAAVLTTWDICLENVLIENTSPSLLVRKHEISIQSEGSTMLFCSAYSVPC